MKKTTKRTKPVKPVQKKPTKTAATATTAKAPKSLKLSPRDTAALIGQSISKTTLELARKATVRAAERVQRAKASVPPVMSAALPAARIRIAPEHSNGNGVTRKQRNKNPLIPVFSEKLTMPQMPKLPMPGPMRHNSAFAQTAPESQDLHVGVQLLIGNATYAITNFPTANAHTSEARADLLVAGVDPMDKNFDFHSVWSAPERATHRYRYSENLQDAIDVVLDDYAELAYTVHSEPAALWLSVTDARKNARYHRPHEFLFVQCAVRAISFKHRRMIEGDAAWLRLDPLLREALMRAGDVEDEIVWLYIENKSSVLRSDRALVIGSDLGHALSLALVNQHVCLSADDALEFALKHADVYETNRTLGGIHVGHVNRPDGHGHESQGG